MAALLLVLIFFGSLASAGAASLEELARAEGEVVFYSSFNNERLVALRDAFQKKHPFLKVNFYRAGSERVMQRILTEAQAGRHAVDLFTSAGFQVQVLKEKGLTARFIPDDASFYARGFRDPDGHWTAVHSLLNSMGYNSKHVSAADAPKNYDDLLQPRWKGRIGLNIRDAEWFANMMRVMGRDKGLAFMRKLAAQRPGLQEGHNLLAQLLAAGEFHVVVNSFAHILAREKVKGAPVQWVLVEPVITYIDPLALALNAPHPNAGKLFINFILSKEGQSILAAQGTIPGRSDVEPQVLRIPKGTRLAPSDLSLAREYESAAEQFRKIFLGQ
jgi:iron(III) transport system substrate-binding protein